ncbi:hypothetical protein Sjap_011353 [Stephania japonica]|uniref:Uncharacterized protein n=1 Tax=Stephania japonica TaxID=461633 RepID=A0AAP0JB82_9MAGN
MSAVIWGSGTVKTLMRHLRPPSRSSPPATACRQSATPVSSSLERREGERESLMSGTVVEEESVEGERRDRRERRSEKSRLERVELERRKQKNVLLVM